MKLTLESLMPVYLLIATNSIVQSAATEFQEDEATFIKKDLPEIVKHIESDPTKNAAIFNVEGVQCGLYKQGDEYVIATDLEMGADDVSGEGEGWTLQQAISAIHNPDGPEPMAES
jgi:hypothetical protein